MFCPNHHGEKLGSFCSECGAELIKNPPVVEEEPYKVKGLDPCQCGYELKNQNQKFCPGCGHSLDWSQKFK